MYPNACSTIGLQHINLLTILCENLQNPLSTFGTSLTSVTIQASWNPPDVRIAQAAAIKMIVVTAKKNAINLLERHHQVWRRLNNRTYTCAKTATSKITETNA